MFLLCQGMPGPKEKSLNPKKLKPFQTNGSLHMLSVYDSTRSVASPWWSVPPWNCLPQYPSFPQDVKEKNHVTHTMETSWTLLDESMNLYDIFKPMIRVDLMLTYNAHTHTHTPHGHDSCFQQANQWIERSVLQKSTTPCTCQVKCHLFRRVLSVAAAQGMFAVLWASLDN